MTGVLARRLKPSVFDEKWWPPGPNERVRRAAGTSFDWPRFFRPCPKCARGAIRQSARSRLARTNSLLTDEKGTPRRYPLQDKATGCALKSLVVGHLVSFTTSIGTTHGQESRQMAKPVLFRLSAICRPRSPLDWYDLRFRLPTPQLCNYQQ